MARNPLKALRALEARFQALCLRAVDWVLAPGPDTPSTPFIKCYSGPCSDPFPVEKVEMSTHHLVQLKNILMEMGEAGQHAGGFTEESGLDPNCPRDRFLRIVIRFRKLEAMHTFYKCLIELGSLYQEITKNEPAEDIQTQGGYPTKSLIVSSHHKEEAEAAVKGILSSGGAYLFPDWLLEQLTTLVVFWMEEAARNQTNTDFYRNLVDGVVANLGPVQHLAFVSDDGSTQDSPLRLKAPELVRQLADMATAQPVPLAERAINHIPQEEKRQGPFGTLGTLLTVHNTSQVGRPCRIFDAEGKEVEEVIEADLVSGGVVRYALNDNGMIYAGPDGNLARVKEVRPAPLRVEWLFKKEDKPVPRNVNGDFGGVS